MIKLVIDSTSEIGVEEAKDLGLTLIPMKVIFDDEEYLVGVNLTTQEFYQKLAEAKNLPKTTQINFTEYVDAVKPILDAGDQVFAMCLSSELSGSFNNLKLAQSELGSENFEAFDTLSVTFAYKALVLEAMKLIKNGVTLRELKAEMERLKTKLRLFAIIDNVKYLIKGGRLSQGKGLMATALNIKPIVAIENGKVEVIGKAVGFNMALKSFCKLIKNVDLSRTMFSGHAADEGKAEKMIEYIKNEIGLEFRNLCEIGAVIGTHAGPGTVGVVYFEK